MLLRASGQRDETEYDVTAVTDDYGDAGVPHSAHLRALTEAAIAGDWLGLAEIRGNAERELGLQETVDTLVVASAFNGITRVADCTGIPLDETTARHTADLREVTGIQRFAYDEKSARYDD